MQRQRIDTTRAIMMQTVEFQQGLNVGLCGGGCRFKLELPVSEELLRRDARHIAGWIGSFVEQGVQ